LLLPPDQMCWCGLTVNNQAIQFGEKQDIVTRQGSLPLLWDGKTYFFLHARVKESDKGLPRTQLTGETKYRPREYAIQSAFNETLTESKNEQNCPKMGNLCQNELTKIYFLIYMKFEDVLTVKAGFVTVH